MSRRVASIAAAVAAVGGFALVLLLPAHLTVQNDGFSLGYGWAAMAGAALAAVGAIGLAVVARRVPARAACGLLAVAAVVLGVQRGSWQVGADRSAITARTMTDTSRIAWPEVKQVHSDTEALEISGFGEARIRIGLTGLRPHDRLTLERTVSRRVQETAPAVTPTP